jgi:hypothetical protein
MVDESLLAPMPMRRRLLRLGCAGRIEVGRKTEQTQEPQNRWRLGAHTGPDGPTSARAALAARGSAWRLRADGPWVCVGPPAGRRVWNERSRRKVFGHGFAARGRPDATADRVSGQPDR